MSFPARKFKIEFEIAMKIWDILKATHLIALLHISNKTTAYLCEISRYIKYFETRTRHLLCGIKRGAFDYDSYSSQTRPGSPPPPHLLRLLDSLVFSNFFQSWKKIYRTDFFQGNYLKLLQKSFCSQKHSWKIIDFLLH